MEGKRKNKKTVMDENAPNMEIGELTKKEDPVVTLTESKIPAEAEEINTDIAKKIVA